MGSGPHGSESGARGMLVSWAGTGWATIGLVSHAERESERWHVSEPKEREVDWAGGEIAAQGREREN